MQTKKKPWQFIFPLLASIMLLAALDASNLVSAAPVPAKSADSFVDSIGVNVHLTYDAYKDNGLIKSKLQELGIRHIRDGAYQESKFFEQLKDLSKTGIKATLIFSGNPIEEIVSTRYNRGS